MANTKLNVHKIVLQEVCEKLSEAEQYVKKRIEELCDEKKKLSAEEVIYLFTNNRKLC